MKCSKCGKEMTDRKTKSSLIGVEFTFVVAEGQSKAWLEKQLGKYCIQKGKYTLASGKAKFFFCFECWLDSLFGEK
jgi:hypothetical protein